MKKTIQLFGIIALAAIIGFSFVACDNDTTSNSGNGNSGAGEPQTLPSDWQSYSYGDWQVWSAETGEYLSEQEEQAFRAFIVANYNSLSEEGKEYWIYVLPPETHGISIANWPQDEDENFYMQSMYYRKSADEKYMAINPNADGIGGNLIPEIYELKSSDGAFPLGTWINRRKETLVFTSTTIKLDLMDNYDISEVDYTTTASSFTKAGYTSRTISYTPTAEDIAKEATFNEANFRSNRPWIPDTSTITVRAKRNKFFHTIIDNPDMTTFVSDPDIIGVWLAYDYTSDPNTYNPANPENPDDAWGVPFKPDG